MPLARCEGVCSSGSHSGLLPGTIQQSCLQGLSESLPGSIDFWLQAANKGSGFLNLVCDEIAQFHLLQP